MGHDVFISHSSKDRNVAHAACARLEGRDHRCWIAPRDIPPGSEWGEAIVDGIKGARVFVLIFSANANFSQQVRREVERAAGHGLPIVPFRIEDVAPVRSLEYFISSRHWLDALTPPMEAHLNRLADAVGRLLSMPPDESPPPSPRPVGPAQRGGSGPLLIACALVLAVLAAGTGFWLSGNPSADPVADNAQETNLAEADLPPDPQAPVRRPGPLVPLVDFSQVPVGRGSGARLDAGIVLQTGNVPVQRITFRPPSGRLVFAAGEDLVQLFGGQPGRLAVTSPVLMIESAVGQSLVMDIQFEEPVAEVELVQPRVFSQDDGSRHLYDLEFPPVSLLALDRNGRRVDHAVIPQWRTDQAAEQPSRRVTLRAGDSDGIGSLRIVASGVIDFVLPSAWPANPVGGPGQPERLQPPYLPALVIESFLVRPLQTD